MQSTLKRGWFFGAKAFREKALALGENALEGTATKRNYGASAEVKDHHLQMAMRLVEAGMKACKLIEEDLVRLAHGDERKALMALAIKTHTTVPLDWVAERLHMGTRSTVSRTAALVKRKLERDGKLSKVMKKIERVMKS